MKGKKGLIIAVASILAVAILAVSLVVVLGKRDDKNEDDKKTETVDLTKETSDLLYRYVRENLVHSTSTWLYPANPEEGVFSAIVKDYDGDKSNEMITFSLKKDNNGYWTIALDSYKVNEEKVVHESQGEAISISGAGNYQLELCTVTDGNKIRLMKEGLNGGGSTYICQFVTYEVQNGSLVKVDEYFLSEYYRYESYQYEETVSGETYASADEFFEAVADAGFEIDSHNHISGDSPEYDIHGDVDVYDAECFKGDHVFSLLDSSYLLGEERLGYLHDNTEFSVNLFAATESEDAEGESFEPTTAPSVEFTDEDYKILCDQVNYSISNFDCNSDTAVNDAYYVVMDRMGPYSLFFTDDPYVYEKDPKGEFPFEYHYKYPETSVDWIIKNVYNVTPDHNLYVSNGSFVYMYYYEGYYYMCPVEKGFVRDYPEVIETKVNGDGICEIRLQAWMFDQYEYIDVVAEFKEVDGKRIWSIHKITVTQ